MLRHFPLDEYESRWSRLEQIMTGDGFDAAVVIGRGGGTMDNCGDILYLSNHYSVSGGMDSRIWSARAFSGIILEKGKAPELHIDEPEPRRDLVSIDSVYCDNHPFLSLARRLNARGITGRVAFCGSWFTPVKYWRQLRDATPDIDWVDVDDLVRRARAIKSPRELDTYRIAGEAATEATDVLMTSLISGMTEREAAAEAARIVVARGGRIQAIGTNHGDTMDYDYRFPLTGAAVDAPAPGDLVRGTVHAAFQQGYYLDPGRTAVCGTATPRQQRLMEATADIVQKLTAIMRPGVFLTDVAAEGDRLTAAFGGSESAIMKNFPFYGHGIGLSFELPRISTTMSEPDDIVRENMVFGVEAFLADAGVGSAFVEDIVIIGKDENERLTRSPYQY
ncbi:M24 family metallopeptidase [Antarcticimicrobium sediminis]|uniref:Aminopeptidase P family protein n=1 Tax=Antarcticimicrobium sediminis TaxID=2546227 RepID=A0A4R5EUB9_9RHOB|nr:M24 family metallopeptidase [Antarcticimicrobium sediminis]TDE38481.1 aminopeptidase P family protein [Antarcticimicrobium sediminis]